MPTFQFATKTIILSLLLVITIHRIDRITHIINWKEALAPRLAAPVALDGCVEHHRHHGEKGESPTDQNYPKTADMETALDNC